MANEKLSQDDARDFLALVGEETRWQPGESGNLAGRPAAPQSDDFDELLRWVMGHKNALALAKRMNSIALGKEAGVPYNVQTDMAKYIVDRLKGRPRQAVLHQQEEEPVIVRILRGLVDDRHLPEGRQLPAGRALPEANARDEAEIRDGPGGSAGPDSG